MFRSAGFWGDPRHEQIHGDSKEVGKRWLAEKRPLVDLVFVDGGHQYHEAKGDIEIWLPLIKPGGVMAVHDFEKTVKVWRGVDQAVREILVGSYEQVLRVETLVAFKVPGGPS